MNERFVIGVSGKAQHGKDSIAEHLVESHGFTKITIADAVKRIALEAFGWDGKKDERGRRLLQVIGTECGRRYDEDIWVKKLARSMGNIRGPFVVPDVRFENEALFIEDHGILLRVTRPGHSALTGENAQHPSETSLDDWPFQYTIVNDEGFLELHLKVDELMIELEDSEGLGV